jgi:hypothetical protein
MTDKQFLKALAVADAARIAAGELTKDGKLTAEGKKAFRARANAIINETPAQERRANARVRRFVEAV